MNRAVLPALATVLLCALPIPASFADDAPPPYLDNRSDPQAVIGSLYNAINRHEYARAWDYYGDTKPAKDFKSFVSGYATTDKVEVRIGGVVSDGAAGSIYYTIPIAIEATDKDGNNKVFAGCYTLRQVNAQIQDPPFNPIHIEKGSLKPSSADLDSAVPTSCPDAPPIPKTDAALDQARKAFLASYSDQCDNQDPDGKAIGEPDAYDIKYKDANAAESDPDREVRLFRFFCSMAAYNESAVYYMWDDVAGVRQLQFVVPELDIRYENNDSNGKLESVTVTGFKTEDHAVNSNYDEKERTITTYDKWRGVGDAASNGTYLFRNGDFALVQYDVDASYDGKIDPQTVVDYYTAP